MPDPASIDRPWIAAYPPGVPPSYDYPAVPLGRFLDDAARDFPDHTATWFRGATLSWREVRDRVDRLAGALWDLGVDHGDRVAVVLPNLPAHPIATFAVLRLGAVVVQANPLLTEDELTRQLDDAGCRVAIGLTTHVDKLNAVRDAVAPLEHLIVSSVGDWLPVLGRLLYPLVGRRRGPYRKLRDSDGALAFEELLESTPPIVDPPQLSPDDVALLQYTGGTTGEPRGVVLTHANLVANAFQARLWLPDIRAGHERILAALPFFHVYGLTLGMLTGVLSAATLVLQARWDAAEALELIDRTRPTIFPGVPVMYEALAENDDVGKHDISSIRACVSGAAPLPRAVAERFERLTNGARLREGYGLSECSPLTHANPIYGRSKPGTIGLPVTDTVAIVVDPDDPTREVAHGETGELAIHGPQVMAGYWNRPDETADAIVDGWLLTGDLGVRDEEGFFTIVDRKKDVVVLPSGHNVYPGEVEAVLLQHPGVAEAMVVGAPTPDGEAVHAFLVMRPTFEVPDEELVAHCRQHLVGYKVPSRIERRDELPSTAVGKPLRRELRPEPRDAEPAEDGDLDPERDQRRVG
ncbi:MAG: long-chain fatty acid--CoA ligase [Nitriliruptorales bacterium]|nr:long-chain fatty acid--CoA ligase [Nitriliruptorales bacterium]